MLPYFIFLLLIDFLAFTILPYLNSMTSTKDTPSTRAVAVYCGASVGTEPAFLYAATCKLFMFIRLSSFYPRKFSALGHALAASNRPLVYGAGSSGIMGRVSGAVLEKGGRVTGIIPHAMLAAGGEHDKITSKDSGEKLGGEAPVRLDEEGREGIETVRALLRANANKLNLPRYPH